MEWMTIILMVAAAWIIGTVKTNRSRKRRGESPAHPVSGLLMLALLFCFFLAPLAYFASHLYTDESLADMAKFVAYASAFGVFAFGFLFFRIEGR
jgi:Na+/proline symporter